MKRILIGALALLPLFLAGQPKWEFGLSAGGWMYMGDVAPTRLPVLRETQPGGGLLLRRHLGRTFALRGSAMAGRLSGSDANIDEKDIRKVRLISFESRMLEAGLMVEWAPFAGRRYPGNFQFRKLISPYVFAGGAWFHNEVTNDYSRMPSDGLWGPVRKDQTSGFPASGFSIPFGGGLHIDLNKRSVLSAELNMRRAMNDHIDGVSYAGNPGRNDWYAFGGMTYNFRFTEKDRDGDGIPDKYDLCPRTPGVLSAMGCPDADGDGLEDLEDLCPNEPGPRAANGCPDADGDNVPDHLDDCPFEAGLAELGGCPDRDGDGIPDKDDACPDDPGLEEFGGCPDTDGDGIPDPEDECPDEPGVPEKKGCPYRDSDGDGIYDDFDECPDEPGLEEFGGCPDTDGDGIPDKDDLCPDLPGIAELRGCPVIPEEKKQVLITARWGVQFETGSAQLKPQSLPVLDQIAEMLMEYPAYNLQISGHTDSRGDAAKNLALSKRRAKSCVDYLLDKGIDAGRLFSQGFGKTKPIATNKTAAGRSHNRRVEFDLVFPGN